MLGMMFKSGEKISSSRELSDYLGGGYGSISGVNITPGNAMKFAPVFSCVRVLAETLGQLPLNLYKHDGKSREKAVSHKLHRLLHLKPNDYMTSQEFKELIAVHLCLRGNFYAYINKSRFGTIMELLPLQPDAVTPKLLETGSAVYDVTFADGSRDILAQENVLHIKLMSMDGLTGMSPIEYTRQTLELASATEQYGSRLFKNGARPGGLLSTDGKLNQDQVDSIREQWNEIHQGGENAHKVAVLQGGLNWTAVGMNPEDAQFLETQKYKRSEIAGIFRVPPHMVGDLEKATFSNIEHQAIQFVTHAVAPLVTRIEQRMAVQLLTEKEQGTYYPKFVIAGLLRGDMKARAEFYNKLYHMSSINPNEIRELEDMNPYEGGDTYYQPQNMAPIGEENEKPEGEQNADEEQN